MGTVEYELRDGKYRTRVEQSFRRAADVMAYKPTVIGADRHGSYVWEAVKDGDLKRTLTVSLTPGGDAVLIETWAVASRGRRYVRVPGIHVRVVEGDLDSFLAGSQFGKHVLVTASLADEITEDGLTDSYWDAPRSATRSSADGF